MKYYRHTTDEYVGILVDFEQLAATSEPWGSRPTGWHIYVDSNQKWNTFTFYTDIDFTRDSLGMLREELSRADALITIMVYLALTPAA